MNTVSDIIKTFNAFDKNAFVYKSGFRTFPISYRQLYKKIHQAQNLFSEIGLKKGDRIMLWGYNSTEWATVFLAAADMGIVVVPIDYLATEEFVYKIHSQVDAKVLFYSEFKPTATLQLNKVILDYLFQNIESRPDNILQTTIKPSDILEIVYTSGTTGDPKGVIITHENIIENVKSVIEIAEVSEDQKFLSLLPMSHLFEQNPGFLSPLSKGCTIVYIRGLRPQLIFKTLKQEHITNIIIVPRILKLLKDGIMREVEAKGRAELFKTFIDMPINKNLKKILFMQIHKKFGFQFKYFVVGGATLDQELEIFWNKIGFCLVQGYGMTECSPVITANTPKKQIIGSIGKPVSGVEVKTEENGQLLTRGKNVTQGYFKNDKKTKELFSQNRWLCTGDVVEIKEDGNLYLKGRIKDIIVTSAGVNVYPEDIERIILKNKKVKDVCVLGVPEENGEVVHAELILKEKTSIDKIIDEANVSLNESQKITSFGEWPDEDFPRTTTMKIKKRFVLERVQNRNTKHFGSSNTSVSKLYFLIGQVAQIDPTTIKSNDRLATDLKMTSINRVELISMVETELNIDISEDDIDVNTKVKDLEMIIKQRKRILEKDIYHRFLLSLPMRITRGIYNYVITDMTLRVFCRRKVTGRENLSGFEGPAIFIANHVGYFDAPNILMSLPFGIRHKIASAAWKEYFEIPKRQIFKKGLYYFYYLYASLFTNIYLFPKKKGFKPSFEYTGELLDKGWNILFFPEGEHSKSGKLQPFRSGIGLLVKEMRVPVVPIKHEGLENIMAGDEHQIPRFGKVTIKIGKPLYLDYSKSIPEITNLLYEEIEKM